MDTDNFDLFRKSSEKPPYKEKVRIRWYEKELKSNTTVFLEIKKKFQGVTFKRRINLTQKSLKEYLNNPEAYKHFSKEMAAIFRRYRLKPKVYLSYDRLAWTYPDNSEFRITLDSHLKYKIFSHPTNSTADAVNFNSKEGYILECKSDCNFPIEFIRVLSSLGIHQTSFSKIGTIYTKVILGGIKNV